VFFCRSAHFFVAAQTASEPVRLRQLQYASSMRPRDGLNVEGVRVLIIIAGDLNMLTGVFANFSRIFD
jgi:hypothetical protein